MNYSNIQVKSRHLDGAEISWFAPICNGDDELLGSHDFRYKSDWSNTSDVLLTADRLGYRNILCPSSYQVGQDTLTFASAIAPLTQQINLLTAIRCGEVHPPMLARALATLDHLLKGRLTINIISSNLPGTEMSSEDRYQRSREVIEILKQAWTQEEINFEGKFYSLKGLPTDPVKPYQQNGGPLLYFGGYSASPAKRWCAMALMTMDLWRITCGRASAVQDRAVERRWLAIPIRFWPNSNDTWASDLLSSLAIPMPMNANGLLSTCCRNSRRSRFLRNWAEFQHLCPIRRLGWGSGGSRE